MTRVQAIGGGFLTLTIGAALGWWAAGAWYAAHAPPPPAPGAGSPPVTKVVLDAEVFVDHGESEAVRQQKLEATRTYLESERIHNLVCATEPPLDAARGTLSEKTPSGAFVVLGRAYMTVSSASGAGSLKVEGYKPVTVEWTGADTGAVGTCAVPIALIPDDGAAIVGVVRDATGAPVAGLMISGCGANAITAIDGSYYLEPQPGPCSLSAPGVAAVPVTAPIGEVTVVDFKQP